MSKFKEVTGSTPQSSSGESTEVLEQPSLLSARTDNTQISTQTTNQPLPPMLSADRAAPTTPTTVITTEKTRQHSVVLRVVLSYLLKIGMVKRFRVLSQDGVTVLKIRYEFDMSQWTEGLEPR